MTILMKSIGWYALRWIAYIIIALGHVVKVSRVKWEDRDYNPVEDSDIPEPPKFELLT